MTINKFNEYLQTLPYIETQLVHLRYKYAWENEWTYSNEILTVNMNVEGYYCWLKDWNEGQQDVEILGCVALSDISVPFFISNKCGCKMSQTEENTPKAQDKATIEPKRIDLENETKAWLDKIDAVDALGNIADICIDWDGYRTADGLGGLINEIWAYARYCAHKIAKEQEPVKPKKINRYIDFDGEGESYIPETYDCGACGNELPWKANYCPTCGRGVKWE